jgi:sialate O-acetylesterase
MKTPHLFPRVAPLLAAALSLAFPPAAAAAVSLAAPFTGGMVLQRGMPVPVWGMAEAGQDVTVEFAGQSRTATAAADGRWSVTLGPLTASAAGRTLTVRGRDTVTLDGVVVGEVWLCAGQSNMLASLERLRTSAYATAADREAAAAIIAEALATGAPGVRVLQTAPGRIGAWSECAPEALRDRDHSQGFSALGYFFGKRLREALQVPIGLIETAVGGSRIETWTPPAAYAASPAFARETAAEPMLIDGVEPGKFHRSMVAPLAPLAMRGVIWYQGESNVLAGDSGPRYADKLQALIEGWRGAWALPELAFLIVQLPPYAYSGRGHPPAHTAEALPWVREGQAAALRVPGTGMVVTTDLAPVNDLHPADKWDLGRRLADLALARAYGRSDLHVCGPRFAALARRDAELVLDVAPADAGLRSRDGGPLSGFAIAGDDRVFHPARAAIVDGRVVVSSPLVPRPVAVRFAWHEQSRPNLCDGSGLPAMPFRSDDWPVATVPTAAAGGADGPRPQAESSP